MKNELYLEYKGGDFQYFDTNKENEEDALREFESIMSRVGLNMDNMRLINYELRKKYE